MIPRIHQIMPPGSKPRLGIHLTCTDSLNTGFFFSASLCTQSFWIWQESGWRSATPDPDPNPPTKCIAMGHSQQLHGRPVGTTTNLATSRQQISAFEIFGQQMVHLLFGCFFPENDLAAAQSGKQGLWENAVRNEENQPWYGECLAYSSHRNKYSIDVNIIQHPCQLLVDVPVKPVDISFV